jgi:hypothetical protein
MAGAQHGRLVERPADELQADRHAGGVDAARERQRGQPAALNGAVQSDIAKNVCISTPPTSTRSAPIGGAPTGQVASASTSTPSSTARSAAV